MILRRSLFAAGAVAVVAATAALSIAFGTRIVDFDAVVAGIQGDISTPDSAAVASRIPRTILALIIGAMLAISGTVLQGVTRNPLADPGILGVSQGASLGVVISMTVVGITAGATIVPLSYTWIVAAILGAAGTSVFVYAVGSMGRGGATPLKLALSGAVVAAALSSIQTALLLTNPDMYQLFLRWDIGGVGGATYADLALAAPFFVGAVLLAVAMARGLNTLALGDELAAGLGEKVWRTRLLASLAAVVLAGVATAISGPIGFVGLVVPHAIRLVLGPDHRWLIPLSALGGAALLVSADLLGRVVARPEEIEVGILTALVGGPVFVVIARTMRARGL